MLSPRLTLAFALALLGAGPGPQREWIEPLTGMRFVWIPAGSFLMGSPEDEPMREAQEVRHAVTLSHGFWLGATEVTQTEWERVLGTRPSRHADCPSCPVEEVNAFEIDGFLKRYAERAKESFRLPTEAEWEYACRAGSQGPFATGARLTTAQANFHGLWPCAGGAVGEVREKTTPVASFPANAWGVHDMHGNVWEWVADEHCPYSEGPIRDPRARCGAPLRVIRGGSWLFGADSARCALRYTHNPRDRGPSLGFRVVRETR